MDNQKKSLSPLSGGFFIFVGLIGGALYGTFHGQPSWWMVMGFAAGIAISLGIWLFDRRKG